MPTQQEVLDAFNSLGGTFNQPMALSKALEAAGFDVGDVAIAITAALANGSLVLVASGSIRKGIQSHRPGHCQMCGHLLDDPADPVGSKDCGGDCCRCMASCGDIDCYDAMNRLEPERYPLDDDGGMP